MKRKNLILLVLLLAIGFAAVSTTLILNGTLNIGENNEDFDVYFSKSIEDGAENNKLIKDDIHLEFSKDMSLVGEKYVLDYDVTNGSRNYDAEITINCTESNEYLKVTNEFDTSEYLLATETRRGKLTIEVLKPYVGDNSEPTKDINITCEIVGNAKERESLAEIPEKEINEINLRWEPGTEAIEERTMKAVWDSVEEIYEVGLIRNGEKVNFNESTLPDGATLLESGNIRVEREEVDLTKVLASNTDGGEYKVTVNANNQLNTSSELKTLARLNEEDLSWDGYTAKWKAVEGAEYYLLWMVDEDGNLLNDVYNFGQLKDVLNVNEQNRIVVYASGNAEESIDLSVVFDLTLMSMSYQVLAYSDQKNVYTPQYELGKSEIN